MSIVTFDIEANGLLRDATKIWCISIKLDSEEPVLYTEGSLYSAASDLKMYSMSMHHTLVGHNISGYDIPLLKKLLDIDIDLSSCVDTLILSQMLEPEEFQHSLESWGEFVGEEKLQHETWSEYTPEMGARCNRDCDITYKVYKYLTAKPVQTNKESLLLEMKFNRIMSLQEVNGWMFDKEKAVAAVADLQSVIDQLSKEILTAAPKRVIANPIVKRAYTKAGSLSSVARNFLDTFDSSVDVDVLGDFCLVSFEQMNLNSVSQLKEYLLTLGWRPTEFNYKKDGKRVVKDDNGKPIITSAKLSNLESIENEIGTKISKRILYSHRRNQIQGWLERVREDGRLSAGGVSCGCNTTRVRHTNIVNVPKASDEVFLGKVMRSLFKAADGKLLLGADLDQLESRVAGHFTTRFDNGEYAELLLKGDPHDEVAKIMQCTRAVAKQINYALQYGAQIGKLASILNCSEGRAKFLWNEWWKLRSSLTDLREAIFTSIESRGYDRKGPLNDKAYVKTIDGRPIFIRSWHSALNALIQSTGSILFKVIVVRIFEQLEPQGLIPVIVGNFHDEVNFEIDPEQEELFRNAIVEACEYVNKKFNLAVPLSMDARVGLTWADIH